VRFSQLVVELPRVKELDINPLLASPERLLALDARVVLHDAGTPDSALPRPAIRPYPDRYVSSIRLKNGEEVEVRPIRPEDEPLLVQFHERLSERSVYLRYFHPYKLSQRIAHERLRRICFIDYDREMALIVVRHPGGPSPEVLAVARLSKRPGTDEGELAVLISDEVQHQGLGTGLWRRLIDIATDEGLQRVFCHVLMENAEMRAICKRLGFKLSDSQDGILYAELPLSRERERETPGTKDE
jgi:acetyltransferase